MNEVYEFLKACGTYYLATVEDGQPRVRPFGTIDCWEGKLTIQTGLKKNVAKQMLACPKVEISATAADGRWIRLTADAVLVEDIAAAEHMLDAYPSLRAMYTPGDGNTAVFALENAKAVICSFTAAPVEYEF
ncbi:MAG: pyridoxamine 5'-phosphate oxidase family protein [Clostridiales bacterium]|nr:pyridoxamine 5'-phosphate oxidase family protein [Clostridia bacterium]MBR5366134.1 pyridoxamine 5'-phosphate oxidase family protein [Clostridia bacterium]MCR4905179.1 pyridoxamine 5'-phosphate oxidase family protein [Clostridiales bacterium]